MITGTIIKTKKIDVRVSWCIVIGPFYDKQDTEIDWFGHTAGWSSLVKHLMNMN